MTFEMNLLVGVWQKKILQQQVAESTVLEENHIC